MPAYRGAGVETREEPDGARCRRAVRRARPFRKPEEPGAEAPEQDEEEQIAKVIREHDPNQMFVAFTATPAPATVSLFGQPFDTYSEAEAIAEDYIVDVASSIISYKTLYNLHCPVVPKPDEERLYPKAVVAKALYAFSDFVHSERRRGFRKAARNRDGCPGAVSGQRASGSLPGETRRHGEAQGVRVSTGPLREEFPFPDLFLHLCAGDQGARGLRRVRGTATDQIGRASCRERV